MPHPDPPRASEGMLQVVHDLSVSRSYGQTLPSTRPWDTAGTTGSGVLRILAAYDGRRITHRCRQTWLPQPDRLADNEP